MIRSRGITQIKILKTILEEESPAFGDLLEKTGLSKPSLTEHLEDLVKRGVVLKERSGEDKRKYIYSINPNELILISVDEVVNGLKQHGIEVSEEEAEKLREFLLKSYRPYIEEKLKEGKFDEENYPSSKTDVFDEVLGFIVGSVNLFELRERIQKTLEQKGKKADIGFSDQKLLPKSFVEKVTQSKFYRDHLITRFCMVAMCLLSPLFSELSEVDKLEKEEKGAFEVNVKVPKVEKEEILWEGKIALKVIQSGDETVLRLDDSEFDIDEFIEIVSEYENIGEALITSLNGVLDFLKLELLIKCMVNSGCEEEVEK